MERRDAIKEFEAGHPSTKAFEAFGLPFEGFLRWATASEKTRAECIEILRLMPAKQTPVRM